MWYDFYLMVWITIYIEDAHNVLKEYYDHGLSAFYFPRNNWDSHLHRTAFPSAFRTRRCASPEPRSCRGLRAAVFGWVLSSVELVHGSSRMCWKSWSGQLQSLKAWTGKSDHRKSLSFGSLCAYGRERGCLLMAWMWVPIALDVQMSGENLSKWGESLLPCSLEGCETQQQRPQVQIVVYETGEHVAFLHLYYSTF